ncbi:hypothetical protein LMG7974_00113 [Campylobacter majalis]|uniref:Lipoprotein n=1 Tax=Campylobacter majalis TaxID=2790656 RepID=A0ABN7K427_9BACT|nr:hypothetical protein [Campylobacter majalis]CAD7286845.1 hypothetical protein LMG7974_00113 [Campylobacter majalis]
MKYTLILVAILFSGCFYEPKTPTKINQITKPPIKTAIKGIITELSYNLDGYCYHIVSTDTSNAKLENIKFCSPKFYYHKGDLVYATFLNNKIQSMLLIKEAKNSQQIVKNGKKNIKSNIITPKEEKISFD